MRADPKSSGPILITGSEGLIGTELKRQLQSAGHLIAGFDLRGKDESSRGDILDEGAVSARLIGCQGVIHLAAVSRVKTGEELPELCMRTNFEGTAALLRLAEAAGCKWFLYASSREVYGRCNALPATEDSPVSPINIYGVSKARAEEVVSQANRPIFRTGIARFSNVFGCARDHDDRVVPAFMKCAMTGASIRLDGPESIFDFTFVDEVVDGVVRYMHLLQSGHTSDPIHFVSERPTSLQQLADLCREVCGRRTLETHAAARTYDVSKFWGSSERARHILKWNHSMGLPDALRLFRQRIIAYQNNPDC